MRKWHRAAQAAAVAGVVAALGGCAGPSTRVLPRKPQQLIEMPEQAQEPQLEEVNPYYLEETMEILTQNTREPGSLGAAQAVSYITKLFTDYGYEVMSANGYVAAVRHTESKDADILVVGSHYGTSPGSVGADDDASAVAVMLEVARLLAKIPSDTELHFVAFASAGGERGGVDEYLATLEPDQKKRVIGQIQLGPQGGSSAGMALGTVDGRPTLLGDLLQDSVRQVLGGQFPCEYRLKEGGAASVFVRNMIPAVWFGSSELSYGHGTVLDTVSTVRTESLEESTRALGEALSGLLSPQTPAMLAKSRYYNDLQDTAYIQRRDAALPFGQTRSVLEARTGQTGVLFSQNTDNNGTPIEGYQYQMKWFGVDQILITTYYFWNGALQSVSVDGDGAGVEFEEMRERISAVYGEEDGKSTGPNGTQYQWHDPVCKSCFTLVPGTGAYALEITPYEPGRTEIERWEIVSEDRAEGAEAGTGSALPRLHQVYANNEYRQPGLDGGIGAGPAQDEEDFASLTPIGEHILVDTRSVQLLELVGQLLPMETGQVTEIGICTDGLGGIAGEVKAQEREDGQISYTWWLDINDALTEDGRWRDRQETVRLVLALYGQTIAAENPQNVEEFTAASQQADQALGDEDAAKALARPGYAESFAWFVLVDLPQQDSDGWKARMEFFYQFPELTSYRANVRKNLGFED